MSASGPSKAASISPGSGIDACRRGRWRELRAEWIDVCAELSGPADDSNSPRIGSYCDILIYYLIGQPCFVAHNKKKHNKDKVWYQRVVHESVAHIAASSSKSNANVEMRQKTSSDSMYNLLKWMGKENE